MNVKSSLIREVLRYEFEVGYNVTEDAKNLFCEMRRNSWSQYNNQILKQFCSDCKNLDDQRQASLKV